MSKLPEFKTEEEFVAWVDSHDLAPYMDEMEEVEPPFDISNLRLTKFSTKPIDVRWRTEYIDAIEAAAERRGIPYQMLVQEWLLEKLNQEEPDLLPAA